MSNSHLPCEDCGSSDALANYGNHTYCFSCNKKRWIKLQELEAFSSYFPLMEDVLQESGELHLPATMTSQFSRKARQLLLKYGLTAEMCFKYDIGFVAYEEVTLPNTDCTVTLRDRIILPIYDNTGAITCYQARETLGDNPKYYTIGTKALYEFSYTTTVVLVEDMMSAMRIRELGTSVVALLGTKLSEEDCLHICNKYDNIIIWLDDDGPGIQGANKIYRQVHMYVKSCSIIKQIKEPKLCFDSEIKKVLSAYVVEAIK